MNEIICLVYKGKGKVVGGLSPALAYWRGVAAFAAANFPSPRADLLALHHVCSMPFTTLPFDFMANSDHMFDRRGGEQLTFLVIGYDLVH